MQKAKWTIGRALFFIVRHDDGFDFFSLLKVYLPYLKNRYYTLFVVVFNNYALFSPGLTDNFCRIWFRWQGWTGIIACALAETILQLRLYALYYGNKKILALMVGFFLAAMATSATIMGNELSGVEARANLIPTTKFCIPVSPLPHFYAFWVPILCFETLLCILACARGYKSYRDHEISLRRRRPKASVHDLVNTQAESENVGGLNILEILLRDSVGYFIIMFATYLTTTMIWIFGSLSVIEIPVGFTVALSSVIGNRLLLNLRGSQASATSANTNSPSIVGTGYSNHLSTGVITIDDECGQEMSGYEMRALRNLKASV
ncbi:hypothetical protein DFH11DRAFT_1570744 [Phellopilus nigrolimitatus]|nr:hypothetical protein DFH11DRAFT_1570744 [Phellopilus nigrolimitatus]